MRPWLVISLVLTAAAVVSAVLAERERFGPLPDPMPIHWNWEGKPDGWAPRAQALKWMLFPAVVMGGTILLGLVIPWLSPQKFRVEPFRATYERILVLLVALFGFIHVALLLSYLRPGFDGSRILVGGLTLFFSLLGNLMGKVRRNFWVGVRTPWTLASETVWNRTHRVTAWVWTPGALVLGVAILMGLPLLWAGIPFFAMVFFPVFYSLYLYKRLERAGKLDLDSQETPAEGASV